LRVHLGCIYGLDFEADLRGGSLDEKPLPSAAIYPKNEKPQKHPSEVGGFHSAT